MQARARRLMATKRAAATLVGGSVSDGGLAAMSDCSDLTSQLARELTMGIRDEVEDVAEMFKKMAIIKDADDTGEDLSGYIITDDVENKEEKIISITAVTMSDKIRRAMQLARQASGLEAVVIEETYSRPSCEENKFVSFGEQLSLFDLAG